MSMILIKLDPNFDKSILNPNLGESKVWFDEMAEQLYNSKLEVEKKLEKGIPQIRKSKRWMNTLLQ